MKKKIFAVAIVAFCLIVFLLFGVGRKDEKKIDSVRIAVLLYRFDDTFISDLRAEMEEYAKAYENKRGIKVNLEFADAKEVQSTQNKQLERFISLDYDALCVNPVDRVDTSSIINMAMGADKPVIFFNRQPVPDDMERYDNAYYVGVSPKESGILQANILLDAYNQNATSIDLNEDGIINYVLLEGEPSHQDSIIRTQWVIKTLEDGGVVLNKLAGEAGNWERSQGAALMDQWLKDYGSDIELVISNNDDMALGAIDSITRDGKSALIKVVGIDGTKVAVDAIRDGKLFGTVASKRNEYAKSVLDIAINKSIGVDVEERYVDVSQEIIR